MPNKKIVRKSSLKAFLDGYSRTEQFIKKERRKYLAKVSAEESLREYDQLCKTWESLKAKKGSQLMEQRRIDFIVRRRNRLNKASESRA